MYISPNEVVSRAMLIHHCKSSGAVDVTVHTVHYHEDGQTIGEGRVLGAEEKAEVVNILNEDVNQSFTLQNPFILSKTPYALAWWIPKAEREIRFRKNDRSVISHKVIFPNMIGIYMRGQLHFAVTKGGKTSRPSAETPLYHVPLPNLYGHGTFCRGNAQIPARATEMNIPHWEAFVFDTVNNHLGSVRPLKGVEDESDLIAEYAKAEQCGRFPAGKLLPMDKTLESWMDSLDRRGYA